MRNSICNNAIKFRMLLPIGDDNRDRRITPFVNYALILANILVFILLQNWGYNDVFTYGYSAVPAEILTGEDIQRGVEAGFDPITGRTIVIPLRPSPDPVYLTLISSMFMHGGLAHLFGNVLFLWVFGDNLENDMGHGRYLFFYLLCGVLAALAHVFSTYYLSGNVFIPSLGASGAISGVLGGYILLHPKRRVHLWIFFLIVSVPAFIAVGLWFVFQVINGMGALGGEEASGVAYAAHIGGFIVGLLICSFFVNKQRVLKKEREMFR